MEGEVNAFGRSQPPLCRLGETHASRLLYVFVHVDTILFRVVGF
jgi:hypothetical protein